MPEATYTLPDGHTVATFAEAYDAAKKLARRTGQAVQFTNELGSTFIVDKD